MAFTSAAFVTSARKGMAPVASATRFAAASSRSAITTFAPSATNLRTMPSPKPEPPPVTMAILSLSLTCVSSTVVDRDGLQRREAIERLEALLAPVARMLDAAERQLDAAAGAIVVDEHLAAVQPLGHAQRAAAVARPHAGHQAERSAVGDGQRFVLAVERDQHLHRAEDLFLRQRVLRRHLRHQRGPHIEAALRRIGHDARLRGDR